MTDRRVLRNTIRSRMRRLRQSAAIAYAPREPGSQALDRIVSCETRQGFDSGRLVPRLVLFLRGTGCRWVADSGGCTFCGFWNATNFGSRIAASDYVEQVRNAMDDPATRFSDHSIICLYNDGSLLDDREIAFDAVIQMLRIVAAQRTVKSIVIEAKLTDMSTEKLTAVAQAAHPAKIGLGIGFESANELVRDLCVNKPVSAELFESRVTLARRLGIEVIALICVKPPFLSERQAIADLIASFEYLEQFPVSRIDLELSTVQRFTLTHELYKHGLYTPPSLWSLREALKERERRGLRTRVYVSPASYTPEVLAVPRRCPACETLWTAAVEHFNETADAAAFDAVKCDCELLWRAEIGEDARESILEGQIASILETLAEREGASSELVPFFVEAGADTGCVSGLTPPRP